MADLDYPSLGTESSASKGFIVWGKYQRRAEVLAPLVSAQICFIPRVFRNKAFRPFDYLVQLAVTVTNLIRLKPSFVFLQVPPVFPAIATLITRTPYALDVHNALIQSYWARVPLNGTLIRHATVLIAHNYEIEAIIKTKYPLSKVFTVADPLPRIGDGTSSRSARDILFICSFGRDEPVNLILDTIRALPEFIFTITAEIHKLNRDLRLALTGCKNVHLTGFLQTEAYHSLLCRSKAAVVLTTMPSVQPSGACEALASDTPLVVSRTALTEKLFGRWAVLADNSVESLVSAIRGLNDEPLDLSGYRSEWNDGVTCDIANLEQFLSSSLVPSSVAAD